MLRTRIIRLLAVLFLIAASSSCGKDARRSEEPAAEQGYRGPDVNAVDPARLAPLTEVLKRKGLYPALYIISHFKASAAAKTKNQIFEEWHAERLRHVDARMQSEMNEWKYPEAKYSRQEECGTLRSAIAVNDTAENFSYAKDLTLADKSEIAAALRALQATGIEFAYNGFDFNGCNLDESTRQMDDYVISPLLIDPASGDLYEFHYRGGCR